MTLANGDIMAMPRIVWPRFKRFLATLGPGVVVMLADTDAGSVITAAQSGAQWGYRLLLLQFLIIPLMYLVQELTVRLALVTGKGYSELVLERFGRAMAGASTAMLVVSCFGALVTELSGLAGVGQIYGVPVWQSATLLSLMILAMVCTGSYRTVERAAMVFGVFELAFLLVAWRAEPHWGAVRQQLAEAPWHDRDYLYLLAANLGTSIMPWTVFYQQSALIDKGLDESDLRAARLDTLLGAVLCQVITAAVLVAAAAAFAGRGSFTLDTVPEIAEAFAHVLGPGTGHFVFALALSGGALVATIVVCLSAAWALGEITGSHHALEKHPREAPWFYGTFVFMLAAAAALVSSGYSLVRLSIATAVLNAVMLPMVLGVLYWLARTALPERHRLHGWQGAVLGAAFLLTSLIGLYAGIAGALGN